MNSRLQSSEEDKIANALRVLVSPSSSTPSASVDSSTVQVQHLKLRSNRKSSVCDSSSHTNFVIFCLFLLQTLLTTGLYFHYHKEGGIVELRAQLHFLSLKLEECTGIPVEHSSNLGNGRVSSSGLTFFKRSSLSTSSEMSSKNKGKDWKGVKFNNLSRESVEGQILAKGIPPQPKKQRLHVNEFRPASVLERPYLLADAPATGVAALRVHGGGGSTDSGLPPAVCSVNGHEVGTYVLPTDEHLLMGPADEAEKRNPELANLLSSVAGPRREVLLTLANGVMICKNVTKCWWNGGNILESFLEVIERANISNHVIGVLDDETVKYLEQRQVKRDGEEKKFQVRWMRLSTASLPAAQRGSREANLVSSLKFSLVQEIMQMGYHTLLSDLDLVYVKNPFDFLFRDSDIESSSDGFDTMAYGSMSSISDKTMGWGGGGLFLKTFTLNVGCAYLRATQRTFALVRRVAAELAARPGWDQQVFNDALMTLAHGGADARPGGNPSVRIMPLEQFVNSKTFFRSRRTAYLPGFSSTAPAPVMVHFNYHPDKHRRMRCIIDRYLNGKIDACDGFPGGSDPNT